jgi:predicted ribosomally synthesized peptide with nif11-like leader
MSNLEGENVIMTKDELLIKLSADAGLMEKAEKCKTVGQIIAFAKENGASVSETEAKGALELLSEREGKLEDEELNAVSGGKKC